ncbi:cytochrome B562 [Defluviimonas sp. 20V17]|uniref:Cytochrome c oxidase subunit 3 n=1 Tax=Allgaiera indica TaxID=765699 RepID=A0AAN4ZZH9_9RHOB|nr:cytochrome c oxidase subunit 3 [Allgaiera indica]KDB02527.1 cytochrome B562 [Defluviimonas sp. 20V17]GHE01956.1 cytochrome B562 [Allgaiera indica]SDX02457.1 cytochrome c oxidase subunit 3 [Allgaiera indica]
MAHETNHDYHILKPSIWPFLGALGAFIMLFGLVLMIHDKGPYMFVGGLLLVLYVMYGWWSEVVYEGNHGDHTPVVRLGLRYGFILFIMSEVMFFAAWFWSFFKHAMYPGGPEQPAAFQTYPPQGVTPFDPWHLPLINTLILLTSGAAITWAHHALVHENNRKDLVRGLALTICLGLFFTVVQAYEYTHAHFGFSGNIYGANFFMATGFHGAHVIIGTLFLFVCMLRAMRGDFTPQQHVGFEAAAWYWHFVDVVWLFLFSAVYIWGSSGIAH